MKPGDPIRLIPEMEGMENHKNLWDSPPNFTNIYTKNHVGRFHYSDIGIVLEQSYVSDGNLPLHTQTTWIKVMCPTGIGWIKRCDTELIR
jgi:hypothetical protein